MSAFQPNFDDYQNKCLDDISALQNEFRELYDIDSYEEWFYDHDIGAFNFKSHDGRNLYFKYVDVGSFSINTNTWNWSWNNASTPHNVKSSLQKVKGFGEENKFEQLTKGLIDGDEYTGWAMTSIAATLLNAIGVYRITQEHLFIYFIFTNELSEEAYNSLKDKVVLCDSHGSGSSAFVCQHLNKNEYSGFHEAFESNPAIEPEDDYQAWCDECEKVRLQTDGWNDESMEFAKIKLICDRCYFEIKNRNQTSN
jgi:transcription elongation factor Elf1